MTTEVTRAKFVKMGDNALEVVPIEVGDLPDLPDNNDNFEIPFVETLPTTGNTNGDMVAMYSEDRYGFVKDIDIDDSLNEIKGIAVSSSDVIFISATKKIVGGEKIYKFENESWNSGFSTPVYNNSNTSCLDMGIDNNNNLFFLTKVSSQEYKIYRKNNDNTWTYIKNAPYINNLHLTGFDLDDDFVYTYNGIGNQSSKGIVNGTEITAQEAYDMCYYNSKYFFTNRGLKRIFNIKNSLSYEFLDIQKNIYSIGVNKNTGTFYIVYEKEDNVKKITVYDKEIDLYYYYNNRWRKTS